MINPYEKILMVMRDQGRTESPLFTGLLYPDGKCAIGDLMLEQGDYVTLGEITVTEESEVLMASLDDRVIILGKVVE
jgi:hypothetical protein